MAMTVGKWRRLQQTAGSTGTFAVMAVDHRGPLRRSLEKESPRGKTAEALTALKKDIVRNLAPAATAVLLDPETAAGQCVADGSMPAGTGLIVALDTGSTGDPINRTTGLIENWSVEKTVRMGASGVKMLLYYNHEASEAGEREALVQEVAAVPHEDSAAEPPVQGGREADRVAAPVDDRQVCGLVALG